MTADHEQLLLRLNRAHTAVAAAQYSSGARAMSRAESAAAVALRELRDEIDKSGLLSDQRTRVRAALEPPQTNAL